jgi:glutamyl-tRNA synthetase
MPKGVEHVRTRFAPSPTGYLHIGGVRTALYNWLFARQKGGQFILRIDDTDAGRNNPAALQPILDGFRWLGIDWDEGPEVGGPHEPYYQSQKLPRYQEAVRQLLDKGLAYWDYSTADEYGAEKKAVPAGQPFSYSRKWRADTAADRARFEAEGRTGAVRLAMPRRGDCCFKDLVRGDMVVPWVTESDAIVQRADGSCLYNLASVVDDQDMGISHVIRAQEHLSNTPRQLFIIDGLGYQRPEYAHLPFVAEPSGKRKLSKREIAKYLCDTGPAYKDFRRVYEHGRCIAGRLGLTISDDTFNPIVLAFYQQVGYLPEAIVNAMLLVGWALDDKTEMFTREEMIRHFKLEDVNKAPAAFDAGKLWAFQDRYWNGYSPEPGVLKPAPPPLEEKVRMALPYLQRVGLVGQSPSPEEMALLTAVVQAAGQRMKVAGDVLDYADFFLPDDRLVYDEKAFDKHVRKAAPLLAKLRALLADAPAFDAASLEARIKAFAEAEGVKLGQVVQPIRTALTGKGESFGVYDILVLHGKERSLARIDRALAGA